jgi:hypothetical protein
MGSGRTSPPSCAAPGGERGCGNHGRFTRNECVFSGFRARACWFLPLLLLLGVLPRGLPEQRAAGSGAQNAAAVRPILRLRGGSSPVVPPPLTRGGRKPFISPVCGGERPAKTLDAVASPDKALALTNMVYLSPADHRAVCSPAKEGDLSYVQINGVIFVAGASEAVQPGTVAFNAAQRKSAQVSIGEGVGVVGAELPDTLIQAASLELSVDVAGRACPNEPVSAEAIAGKVSERLAGHVLSVGQSFLCEVRGTNLMLKVLQVAVFRESVPGGRALDRAEVEARWAGGGVEPRAVLGLIGANSVVKVAAAAGSQLKITADAGSQAGAAGGAAGAPRGSALFRPDFALEDLGIGGLDQVRPLFALVTDSTLREG